MRKYVFAYDANTKEYKGEVEVQASPLEPGVFLDDIPNTLKIAPPAVDANQVAVESNGAWEIRADYRGDWFTPDGGILTISEIGAEPAADWSREPPVTPPQPHPARVTPWQFRKALNQMGLRADVENAITASEDQDLKDGWEFATEFVRDDPLVVSMAAAIGKTDADLDTLFALAKTL